MRRAVRAEFISSAVMAKPARSRRTPHGYPGRERESGPGTAASDFTRAPASMARTAPRSGVSLVRKKKEEISRAGHALSDVRIVIRSGPLADGALVTEGVVIAARGRAGE